MDIYDLYKSGMSIPEVSKHTELSMSTIRLRLKQNGVLRSRTDGVKNAISLGKRKSLKGIKRTFSEEWKKNISIGKRIHGEKNSKGKTKKKNGYVEITRGKDKGRSEHVILIENKIGRRLYSNECVHHINGIRSDNRIDNLQLMTRSEHAKLHAEQNYKNRIIDSKGRFK